jgi:hypothetical protein
MSKDCKAPESIPGIPNDVLNTLGEPIDQFAENKIFEDYVRSVGVNEFTSIFPKRDHDGTQVLRDITGLNTQLFIAFLAENNPGSINIADLSIQASMKGAGIKNPDWMTHRAVKAEFEFYEVKPNSDSGKRKGDEKLLFFTALCGLNNLPYKPGVTYFPRDREEPMWVENKGFIQTQVSLRWSRSKGGLILYEVCIDHRLRNPEKVKVKNPVDAAAVLLMMLILLGVRAAPAVI